MNTISEGTLGTLGKAIRPASRKASASAEALARQVDATLRQFDKLTTSRLRTGSDRSASAEALARQAGTTRGFDRIYRMNRILVFNMFVTNPLKQAISILPIM